MLDRRSILNFDWILFLTVMAISLIGLVTVYSAAAPFCIKQMIWIAIGIIAFFFILSIDYRKIGNYSYTLYGLSIFLLVLVLFIGKSGIGAQRWFSLGPISFQPSELVKLILILALARFLSEERKRPLTIKHLLLPGFFFLLLPLILLLKQPDLGTALLIMVVFITMILIAGLSWRSFLFLILPSILTSPVWGRLLWGSLKDYQKNRILVFLNPDVDPLGVSYHIAQSKIAIGSGRLFGKGYLAGTQGQLRFLPERHTDFIFSVFAEEWGFLGSLILLLLYLFLILWGIEIANKAKDRLGSLMAIGVVSMISFYVIVNIGMTVGLMPVVGIPLPFLSYGGTSIVTAFMSIGILMNVKMRRFMLFY